MSVDQSGESAPYPIERMAYADWRLATQTVMGPMVVHLRRDHAWGYRRIAKAVGWPETRVRKCMTAYLAGQEGS